MRMMRTHWRFAAAAVLALVSGRAAVAEDIRAAMERANTEFLAAFNTPNPSAFVPLYTRDSVLYVQGAAPAAGPEAIKLFWEANVKRGIRDHTFDIIETDADGKYAFQVSKWTVQLVRDTGEKTLISGHSVRIFERQQDGTWQTKIHMVNRPSAP
jgi:uncharacterized protein (TIGR02246 family)